MFHRRPVTAVIALAFVLFAVMPFVAAPVRVSAASTAWHVLAGNGTPDSAVTGMTYYPDTITIDVGDSITWTVEGDAHTISFLSGATPPGPLDPMTGPPAGGSTYDGTGFVSSGIVQPVPPQNTYTLTFTKAGTFPYVCLIHPGMAGTVVVQPAGTPYPETQAQYDASSAVHGQQDLATGIAYLNSLSPTTSQNPDGSTNYNVPAGGAAGMASLMRFAPNELTISVGDTVTWTSPDPMEVHTVTVSPTGVYPEFPSAAAFAPVGGPTYDGSTFTNSGVILPQGAPPPHGIPSTTSYTLKFTKPGTYTYHCLIHDRLGMVGKIHVVSAPGGGARAAPVAQIAQNPVVGGPILTNNQGMTLYYLTSEALGNIQCTSKCLNFWPPLTLPAGQTDAVEPAGSSIVFETIARPDGTTQVSSAYGEFPLYTFAGDKAPGDVNGYGIRAFGGVWLPARVTSFPYTTPVVIPQASGGESASFLVSFSSAQAGHGEVYFGSGPGCSGLVGVATQDLTSGTTTHTIQVAGNDLGGSAGDNGIQPGATYWYEDVTITSAGATIDNNGGHCYGVTIPKG
jgi:plastocyanin